MTTPAPDARRPGIAVTLWHDAGLSVAWRVAEATLRALAAEGLAPPIVVCHAWPDPSHTATLRALRSALPGVRVWYSPGGNSLAGYSATRARATAEEWARVASGHGAEALLPNLEMPSAAGRSGWTEGCPLAGEALAAHARGLYEAMHSVAPALALGLVGPDVPSYHRLPWRALLGEGSPVTLHAPQVYPGLPRPGVSLRGARSRYTLQGADWLHRVELGQVRADVAPGGAGYVVYRQLWGCQTGAALWLADQSDVVMGWALPSRSWPEGLAALRLSLRLRREAGPGRGAIARWQAQMGLAPDGLPGPQTLAALGTAR